MTPALERELKRVALSFCIPTRLLLVDPPPPPPPPLGKSHATKMRLRCFGQKGGRGSFLARARLPMHLPTRTTRDRGGLRRRAVSPTGGGGWWWETKGTKTKRLQFQSRFQGGGSPPVLARSEESTRTTFTIMTCSYESTAPLQAKVSHSRVRTRL